MSRSAEAFGGRTSALTRSSWGARAFLRIRIIAIIGLLSGCSPCGCSRCPPDTNETTNTSNVSTAPSHSGNALEWTNLKPEWPQPPGAIGTADPKLDAVLHAQPDHQLATPLLILPPERGYHIVDLIPLRTGYNLLQKRGDVELTVEGSTSRLAEAGSKQFGYQIQNTEGPRIISFSRHGVDYAISVNCPEGKDQPDICRSDDSLRDLADRLQVYEPGK